MGATGKTQQVFLKNIYTNFHISQPNRKDKWGEVQLGWKEVPQYQDCDIWIPKLQHKAKKGIQYLIIRKRYHCSFTGIQDGALQFISLISYNVW